MMSFLDFAVKIIRDKMIKLSCFETPACGGRQDGHFDFIAGERHINRISTIVKNKKQMHKKPRRRFFFLIFPQNNFKMS
jgi:hypothetical protein